MRYVHIYIYIYRPTSGQTQVIIFSCCLILLGHGGHVGAMPALLQRRKAGRRARFFCNGCDVWDRFKIVYIPKVNLDRENLGPNHNMTFLLRSTH